MNIERAIQIACLAHNGQKDKCGEPYILHPVAVLNNLFINDMSAKITAILHDVFEDSNFKLEHFKKELSESEYEALKLLTRNGADSYGEYIYNITKNNIATYVKIADLKHNLNKDRLFRAIENGAGYEYMSYKEKVYKASHSILMDSLCCPIDKEYVLNKIDSIEKPKKKK